jgi:hypothetical protein
VKLLAKAQLTKAQLTKAQQHSARRRRDFHHKTALALVRHYDTL